MKKPLFTLFLLANAFLINAQNRVYVWESASGANNGSGWQDAFTDLQSAIHAAQPGDSIWVAAGTYLPTADDSRDSSFQLPSGVLLLGGFAGNENQADQRDWALNPTVLSGDVGLPNERADNSYTILFLDNPDSLTVVDGFHFKWGQADQVAASPNDGPQRSGGAVYIEGEAGEAYAVFRNCRFEDNFASKFGGAVYINGKNTGSVAPQFLNCVFARNEALLDGGAVYRKGSSWVERTPDFGGCTFTQDSAGRWGGAIFYEDAEMQDTFQVWDCVFTENTGTIAAGVAALIGRVDGSKISIEDCDFSRNVNNQGIGVSIGILNILSALNYDMITIKGCNFKDEDKSTLGESSIIYIDAFGVDSTSTIQLVDCEFTDILGDENMIFISSIFGSLLHSNTNIYNCNAGFLCQYRVVDGSITIENSSFLESTGNPLDLIRNKQVLLRNVLIKNIVNDFELSLTTRMRGTNVTFINCIYDNSRGFFSDDDQSIMEESNVTFINSYIRTKELYKSGAGVLNGDVNFRFEHCWIDTSAIRCGFQDQNHNIECGPGNIFNVDPMFRDTANNDYSLLPCSPLIDAGDDSYIANLPTDIAGNARRQGASVDIGAYEAPGFSFTMPAQVAPVCHADSSGTIRVFPPVFGCEPYTYAWSDGSSDSIRSGLMEGTYALTLTDSQGKTLVDTVEVPGSSPEVAIVGDTVICSGATGTFTAQIGGMPLMPVEMEWSTGATTNTIDQLPTGPYALTLTDALGCTDSAEVNLLVAPVPGFDFEVTNATHVDSMNGSIMFSVFGGVEPYVYVWNTGDSTASISGLKPGTYTLILFDGAGCNYGYIFDVGVTSRTTQNGTGEHAGRVWPNPTSGILQVEWGAADEFRLYDALGREVVRLQGGGLQNQSTLNLSGLPAGHYSYRFFRNARVVGSGYLVKTGG